MITKTHSVKSLSDARDSEGSPGAGEVDTEDKWEKEEGGADVETTNLLQKT